MTALHSDQSPALTLEEVSADDPRSAELIAQVQTVYRGLYGSEDDSPVSRLRALPMRTAEQELRSRAVS